MPAENSPLATYLQHRIGLDAARLGAPEVSDFFKNRIKALGLSGEPAYVQSLEADRGEFQAMLRAVTVPETYFYRDQPQMTALADEILPRLHAQARAQRRSAVHIWCAGCCTGEEAYSLLLLELEAGRADNAAIRASDVNESYLETARAGVYGKRSVEHVPFAVRERFFERRDGFFTLRRDAAARVQFVCENLVDAAVPTAAFDLIVCRNVLIYFEPRMRKAVLERLASSLRPDGMLLLSPAEVPPPGFALRARRFGDAFVYASPALPATDPTATPTAVSILTGKHAVDSAAPALPSDREALQEAARTFADLGDAAAARQAGERLVTLSPLDAEAHCLLGLAWIGEPEAAWPHFQRAVYLDPDHLLARFHAARCAERLGRHDEAAQEFQNTAAIAARRDPAEILDARDGISCGLALAIAKQAAIRLRQRSS